MESRVYAEVNLERQGEKWKIRKYGLLQDVPKD